MTNAAESMQYRHETVAKAIKESPRDSTWVIPWNIRSIAGLRRSLSPDFWESVLDSFGETRVRVVVAATLILLTTPLVLLGGLWFQGMLLVVTVLAAREWCRLKEFEHTPSYLAVILVSIGAIMFLPQSVDFMMTWFEPLGIVSLFLLVCCVAVILKGKTKKRPVTARTLQGRNADARDGSRDDESAVVQFLHMVTMSTSIAVIVFYLASQSLMPWADRLGFPIAGATLAVMGIAWWGFVIRWRLWTYSDSEPPGTTDRKWINALEGWLVLVPAGAALVWISGSERGSLYVMTFMIIVWATDSAAWYVGKFVARYLGRFGYKARPLAARISPRKTRIGFFGGFVGGISAGAVAALSFGLPIGKTLVAAALAAVASVVGDLYESMAKRRAGVKDTGRLLVGHGGVLDRIDGLTAAAPVYAVVIALPSSWFW